MQINRLFEIIYLLLDRKIMTARELAEYFEVSPRTILRDIDTLSSAKIPVYASQGRGGGISIADGFVLNKSVISAEEQEQILFALKSMASVKNVDAGATLSKLQSLFNRDSVDWIDIDFSNWGSPESELQFFTEIKQAILSKRVLAFDYLNSYGKRTQREVEPLRLVFKAHSWYLQAFCRIKQDYRIYKISRIRELALCADSFERILPPEFAIDTLRSAPSPAVRIELRFSAEPAYRVYDEFDENLVTFNADGSLTAQADYPYDEWVVGHILSFGAGVTVLSPYFLREEVAKRAKLIAEKYSK